MNQQALSSLIWSVADLLRGDFKQSEYARVILPVTLLRRLSWHREVTTAPRVAAHLSSEHGRRCYRACERKLAA